MRWGQEWEEFIDHFRRTTVQTLADSHVMVSVAPPPGALEVQFCAELGAAIMLDKPIVAVVPPGTPIPERLRRVADKIVQVDIDTEAGQQELAEALAETIEVDPDSPG